MLTVQPAPASLIEDGRIQTGFFATPFRKVDILNAPLLNGPLGRLGRRLRLKEWIGFGIGHPELFGGIIIQHAGYAASGTAYLYDRKLKRMHEWLVVELPWRLTMPDTLYAGETVARQGKNLLRFTHELDAAKRHTMTAEIAGKGETPPLKVNLVMHQDMAEFDPLVYSMPINPGHHTFTHKSPLRLEGRITIGDRVFDFDPAKHLGNLDEQKTFYPYRAHWLWSCFETYTAEGRMVMTNFVDQMTPEGEPGEDAIWIDGKIEYIDAPEFLPQQERGYFRVEDKAGRVRLSFTPEGAKVEKRSYGVVVMDYEQFYGRYDGTITGRDGKVHKIEGAYGALERMDAKF